MAFRLSPEAERSGFRLEAHDTVGSTNALALDHARAGDPGRLWVTALKQEAGRGRRGRPWETVHGNLAATLLHVGTGDMANAATLGFVAGLALSDALAAVVPETALSTALDGGGTQPVRFTLKWPNDVLAGGAKLSGILLESTSLPGGGHAVAIGIGVNVVAHPEGTPYPATSLRRLGWAGDAGDLFLALSDSWCTWERVWDSGRGLAAIRDRWLERAAGIGGDVAISVDGSVLRGIFETIDADCRIVIRDETGTAHHINAGDVHFGTVASVHASASQGREN